MVDLIMIFKGINKALPKGEPSLWRSQRGITSNSGLLEPPPHPAPHPTQPLVQDFHFDFEQEKMNTILAKEPGNGEKMFIEENIM